VASKLPLKFRHFFSASTFLKFDRDEYGRIDMQSFFHSIVRKNNLFQTRIHISLYDTAGNGYLTEANLNEYISELIPTFVHLKNMDDGFKEKYILAAIRKFFFFLDPKRTGRIYIKDMLTSTILAELYELRQERYSEEDLGQNWFSIQYATSLHQKFTKLDTDKNGLLKKDDLSKYSKGLSTIVIDRIFEEYPTVNGEMNYKGFLEFVLAMDNKKAPEAIQYFWRILDVYHKGAIDSFIINMFFRSIIQKLEAMEKCGFNVEDIKDEIFDMAKPELPMAITLADLIKCQQGDIIVSMLIDAKAFFDYDQR
jgi:serine/threonine-protein phosphatase 2A regulatory subunit B''